MDPNFFNENSDSFSFSDLDRNPSLSPSDENESSSNETLLKYVSQILMEESIGDKQSMFYDSLALQQTEEMFQQVITDSMINITEDTSVFTASQFMKGFEEGNKLLPVIKKKNHERGEVVDLEEIRISKHSASNVEDGKITDMVDKVLLLDKKCDPPTLLDSGGGDTLQNNNKKKKKKKKNQKKTKSQVVDFRTLLILCAQAVSTGDKPVANGLLLQIRQQSSPLGDAGQRLAHYFANGLEARLNGNATGSVIQTYYNAMAALKETAAETLKAYRVYLSSSPFMTLMYFFSNKMILDAAKDASVLHIVDFGILYGFQWPMFIQYVSHWKAVPWKLRITGVELPQRGFRPAERIEETGRRLAEYCKRFNIPFEYNAIASQNWETIWIDDFDIRPGEVLAVNAGLRLKYLRDETGDGDGSCPRDTVLKLIKDMKPDVFVHSIVNGSFNAPFFTSRFKEAVYHYSALFDMFDSTLPRDNQERIMFEREFYGKEAMNVIACEEADRVERPETVRQWTVRMVRAGFRQKSVKVEIVESFREKLKRWGYHKEFGVDENSKWLLQGWKGRTIYASSCWVPV